MTFNAASEIPCMYGTDDPKVVATAKDNLIPDTTVEPRGMRGPIVVLALVARAETREKDLVETYLSLEKTAEAIVID